MGRKTPAEEALQESLDDFGAAQARCYDVAANAPSDGYGRQAAAAFDALVRARDAVYDASFDLEP